ncbi:MAG: hypothetical protein ACK504_00060 [Bacteroidota bacterium]
MRLTRRLHFIKITVLLGLLCSIIFSYKLWAGVRYFPKAPFLSAIPSIAAPYDYLFIFLLILLIFISFFYQHRMPIFLLLLILIYLCIDDQNRLQAWVLDYTLILFLFLFYKNRVGDTKNYYSTFTMIQIVLASIYIFSGLQKFNVHFTDEVLNLIQISFGKHLSLRQINLLLKVSHTIPYLEILVGIGLLIKSLRYIAIPIALSMHILLLLFGSQFDIVNFLVYGPWNIVMMPLILLAFLKVKKENYFDVSIIFKNVLFYVVITLMFIFPIFSFNNKYDSFLSSALYSGNLHRGNLVLTHKSYHKLPIYIKQFVTKHHDYYILDIKKWAVSELKSPCLPEYRVFESVQDYVLFITKTNSEDVNLNFIEREKIVNF